MSSETATGGIQLGESTVSSDDKRLFAITLFSVFTAVIPAACISLFVTGELATNTIAVYTGLIYLNVFSLALPTLGVIESQPWFVWFIMAFSWISYAALAGMIIKQQFGKFKVETLREIMVEFRTSLILTVLLISGIAVCGYALEWSIMYMAEVYMVLNMNFFALPVVFFTPFMEFSAPSWVIIVAYWVWRIKLTR